jgi:hypothetical protein
MWWLCICAVADLVHTVVSCTLHCRGLVLLACLAWFCTAACIHTACCVCCDSPMLCSLLERELHLSFCMCTAHALLVKPCAQAH